MDIFREHRGGFWTTARRRSLRLGFVLLALAFIIQINAGHYSSNQAITASPVGDVFLDNLPLVNLDFVIVGGSIALWIVASALLVLKPKYLLFGLKSIALFIILRAFFISLTHIGLYPTSFSPGVQNTGYGLYKLTTFQGNLFFSGHTGFPFLMALVFWDNAMVRKFFLAATVIFGASVLLAHVHYSIDVFAAPFMVYSIFVIAEKLFPRDRALFAP